MSKPILCLDFDGVIHSYESGWVAVDFIPDPPVPGAMRFLFEVLQSEKFEVCIFSSRSKEPNGIRAMNIWLQYWARKQLHPEGASLVIREIANRPVAWPTEKPSAFVTLDDRALTFDGTWPHIGALTSFKPWNKR